MHLKMPDAQVVHRWEGSCIHALLVLVVTGASYWSV